MPVGKPRKYKSVASMSKVIDEYFDSIKKGKRPTITGLAYHLGFTSRQDLINYEGYSKEYHDTIKRAKMRVEIGYEEGLSQNNVAGSIFALKNFDWKDKKDLNIDGNLNISIVDYAKADTTV